MFGHQNDESTGNDSSQIPEESIHGVLNDQAINSNQPAVANAGGTDDAPAGALPADTGSTTDGDAKDWQHPGQPLDSQAAITDVISPAGGFPKAPSFPAVSRTDDTPPVPDNPATDDDNTTHELIDIKQHALSELLPLIDQLDQPPEEKFRTIMMMIQASDNEHLVKMAYETAHSITDEKARARALLDIVNEINYFTQQPES